MRQLSSTRGILALSLFLFVTWTSLAIDLGRAFGGKKEGESAYSSNAAEISSLIAIENAKKLVDELNDASTGTITKYQPGREKEPVTCNDIMAKALVVANEEKAAIVEERESVVKAASLLSERIDDLEGKLKAANEAIQDLEHKLKDAEADAYERLVKVERDADAKLKEFETDSARRIEEIMKESARVKQEANEKIEEMKVELGRSQKEAQDLIDAEVKKSKENMETVKSDTAAEIAKTKSDCEEQISSKDAVVAKKLKEVAAEMEQVKLECNEQLSLKDAEVSKKLEESADIMAQKDAFLAEKIKAAEVEIEQIKFRADATVTLGQKTADEKVASILARAEEEKLVIMETSRRDIEQKNKEMVEERKQMEKDMNALKGKTDAELKEIQEESEKRIQQAHDEMEKAIAVAEAKISSEQEKYKKTEKALQMNMIEANQREESLKSEIEELKASISKQSIEINYWMDKHQAQGYCNATLMKEDGRKFAMTAMNSARNLMQSSEGGIGTQLKRAQSLIGDGMVFVEKEVIPKARKEAVSLYDKHVAPAVNKNVVPVYNQHIKQHIHPVYEKHISPAVAIAQKEAGIIVEKSRKEAQKARSTAASLVKQSSLKAIKMLEEKEIDDQVPESVMSLLTHSSKDGDWAVGWLLFGFLTIAVFVLRFRIYRMTGAFFSIIWFFCPLRLFVGERKGVDSKPKRKAKAPKEKPIVKGGNGAKEERASLNANNETSKNSNSDASTKSGSDASKTSVSEASKKLDSKASK